MLVVMLEPQPNNENCARGRRLQIMANFVSDTRSRLAIPLGALIVADQSHKLAYGIAVATLWASDKLDGFLGRRASRLLQKDTSEEGSEKDHIADKKLSHALMGACIVNAALANEYTTAAVLVATESAYIVRDFKMAQARKNVQEHSGSSKAGMYGKAKTTAIAFGTTLMTATEPGTVAHTAGATLTVAGLIPAFIALNDMHRNAERSS